MDAPGLYDTDILEWTEQQAAALRALAARPDLPNALDLENVIEEIEALGRSQFKAATSPIRLIMLHVLKAAFAPDAPALAHWRTEIASWHSDVLDELTPSMHQRVDMQVLWVRALKEAAPALRENGAMLPMDLPRSCPFVLADFLGEDFDVDAAVARIRAAFPAP